MKKKLYTDINISRIDNFLNDHLKKTKNLSNGLPPISSVEISINGACNRRCFFCPRVDEHNYPNILDNLDMKAFENLIKDLKKINFLLNISFSIFCEPLLTKNLYVYIDKIKSNLDEVQIEIVTNGDPILAKGGKERLMKLFSSGLDNCRVSLYDGEHQLEIFEKIKNELSLTDQQLIIRKRYLGPDESYGLTISNRAGSVKIKNEVFELKPLSEPLKQPCHYPLYKVLIDHDGAVLICSNDWKKELIMGNIKEDSIINIWSKHKFIELRKKLCNSNRNHAPCNVCDVNGTLNGQQSFERWKSYFSKQT